MSTRRSMRRKRQIDNMDDTDESVMLSSPSKTSLLSQIDNLSPVSSPLKGPLGNDTETGSPAFVAKCFYGFKSSSSFVPKENQLTPKKKSLRSVKQEEEKPSILQDTRLNEILLERIASSPIKQAVLQRCSVEEFRKLYRDEIKEIEQEQQLSDRRITRRLSKIVWKHNEDSESDGDGWDSSSSNDAIDFKITNRGFDVDSISNGNSSLKSQDSVTPTKADTSEPSPEQGKCRDTKVLNTSPVKTPVSSERKFFKSKSVGKSAGTSNILFGKGFNLRFVRQNKSTSKKRGIKKTNFATKVNSSRNLNFASCQGSLGSTILTASSSESSQEKTSHITCSIQSKLSEEKRNEKYSGDDFDDDLDAVVFNKDGTKTYQSSPKRRRVNYSSKIESSNISNNAYSRTNEEGNGVHADQEDEQLANASQDQLNMSADIEKVETPSTKWFPIFRPQKKTSSKVGSLTSPSIAKPMNTSRRIGKDDQSQMIIDAGQKNFGAAQCDVCGMVFCQADLQDQTAHAKFHKRLLEVLKFPGWKKERVVQEIPLDCAKIVLILSDDPSSHRKKVEELYEVMSRELGFPGDSAFTNPYQKVFLYVSVDREIEGCCVAEPIREGNRVIPGHLDSGDASGRRPWCCEKVSEPALIGISRLWVAAGKRRSGIACRLVEAVQQWFDYGSLIPKDKIAMSDPTPDGHKFARKFFGTPTFLVYKYKA